MIKFLINNSRNHCGTTVGFVTQIKSVESTNKRFAVYSSMWKLLISFSVWNLHILYSETKHGLYFTLKQMLSVDKLLTRIIPQIKKWITNSCGNNRKMISDILSTLEIPVGDWTTKESHCYNDFLYDPPYWLDKICWDPQM